MTEEQPISSDTESQQPTSFWTELKRRHVIRVAGVYAVVAWLIIQVADTTFESFGIPDWAFRFVVITLVLGFPVSLVVAWALELTPDGIKVTSSVQRNAPVAAASEAIVSKRRWLAVGFAAAVPTLIFGTLALVFYLRPGGDLPFVESTQDIAVEQSIAVLPLLNMSADPENGFFAGGVHEDILTNLSRIDGLKVISRTSAMRYINSELSLRDIGEALGVRYIVEGSVRRINNHVRVTVQLIDASADTHLWANNYDRELVDIFATQSAVAREISNSLHLEIQPDTVGILQGMPTHSVKAYDLYMKARSIDRSEAQSEATLIRQRELLEAALAEDPDFVEAWAYLNDIYDMCLETFNRLGWFAPRDGSREAAYRALHDKSLRALKKAVALDPDNVGTLIARASGIVGEGEINEIQEDFALHSAQRKQVMDRIVEEYPQNAMGWYILGWWYNLNAMDNAAAARAFKKALELDPLHARIVEGSLNFFRVAADEEMIGLLFERLAQIAPEKGQDKSLSRIQTGAIIYNLRNALVSTADESLIEIYASELTRKEAFFESEMQALFWRAQLWEIQNKLEALAGIKNDPVLTGSPHEGELQLYTWANALVARTLQIIDQPDSVDPIARRILRYESLAADRTGFAAVEVAYTMVQAYRILGDFDKARQWSDRLFDREDSHFDTWGGMALGALAEFDVDEAVSELLAREESAPERNTSDWFALMHITFRKIIVHPDMQAFYVKEGKWVDYLAERVPEYAKYRKID